VLRLESEALSSIDELSLVVVVVIVVVVVVVLVLIAVAFYGAIKQLMSNRLRAASGSRAD